MANDTGQLSPNSNNSINASLTVPNMFEDFIMAVANRDGIPMCPHMVFLCVIFLNGMLPIFVSAFTNRRVGIPGIPFMILLVGSLLLNHFVNLLFYAIMYHVKTQYSDTTPFGPALVFFAGNLITCFYFVWMMSKVLHRYDYVVQRYHIRCTLLALVLFILYLIGSVYTYHTYLPSQPIPRDTKLFVTMFENLPSNEELSSISELFPVLTLAILTLALYNITFAGYFYISFIIKFKINGTEMRISRNVAMSLVLIDQIFLVAPLYFLSAILTSIINNRTFYGYSTDTICYFLVFLHGPTHFILMTATRDRKPKFRLVNMLEHTNGLHIPLNRGDQEISDMELEEFETI